MFNPCTLPAHVLILVGNVEEARKALEVAGHNLQMACPHSTERYGVRIFHWVSHFDEYGEYQTCEICGVRRY